MKIISVCIMILFITGCSLFETNNAGMKYANSFKKVDYHEQYISSEFNLAKAQNKKLLFILGGNWCHDSRGLAKKLDQTSLSGFIAEHYRLSLVDVGFLERGFEFTDKTEMETYYATPTVLIFDPVSGEHLNKGDMHQWGSADKIKQSVTNNYFKKYASELAEEKKEEASISEQQMLYLNKLKEFTIAQEKRIKAAYKIVGPLLQQYKQGKENKDFEPYWEAVANLRLSLPDDIAKLQKQILAATDKELQSVLFPEYKSFPWE